MPSLETPRSLTTWAFSIGNALIGVLVLFAVFRGTDFRSWVVNAASLMVAVLLLLSSFGLARATRWRLLALRACAVVELVLGLCVGAVLVVSASYFKASPESLAGSGPLTLIVSVALLLPYLLLYPSVQLLWLHGQRQAPH